MFDNNEITNLNLNSNVQPDINSNIQPNVQFNIQPNTIITNDYKKEKDALKQELTFNGNINNKLEVNNNDVVSITAENNLIIDNNQVINNIQTSNIEEVKTEEVKTEEVKVLDNFKIKTEKLLQFLNNAGKVSTNNPRIPVSSLLQLKFSENGFELIAGNGRDILVQKDNSVSFTQDLSIGINAETFSSLISKIYDEYIEIKFDATNRTINVIADDGVFKLPEKYEINTGEALSFPIDKTFDTIPTISINAEDLRKKITKMIVFSAENNVRSELCGLYLTDKIYATDADTFVLIDNIPELANYTLFIAKDLATIISNLDFGSKAQIGLLNGDNTDFVKYIKLVNENQTMTLYAYAREESEYNDYPVDAMNDLANVDYSSSFKFNRSRLINNLEKANLFTTQIDKDSFYLAAMSGNLNIKTINGSSSANMNIISNENIDIKNKLDLNNFIKVLRQFESEEIVFKFNKENLSIIAVEDTENKIAAIISVQND